MLKDFERWLRSINESADDSLLEAFEHIFTLYRLKVPSLLRKTLTSRNPIESMFAAVSNCEGSNKRFCNSFTSQRWLASILLYCGKTFIRSRDTGTLNG